MGRDWAWRLRPGKTSSIHALKNRGLDKKLFTPSHARDKNHTLFYVFFLFSCGCVFILYTVGGGGIYIYLCIFFIFLQMCIYPTKTYLFVPGYYSINLRYKLFNVTWISLLIFKLNEYLYYYFQHIYLLFKVCFMCWISCRRICNEIEEKAKLIKELSDKLEILNEENAKVCKFIYLLIWYWFLLHCNYITSEFVWSLKIL